MHAPDHQTSLARTLQVGVTTPDVTLFIDESKPSPRDHPRGESWGYIGALIVPTNRLEEAADLLAADRSEVRYWNELHFTDVKQAPKQQLAERWLDHVLYGRDRLFYFNLLGIDRGRLDASRFGAGRRTQEHNIHRRFVRTTVASGLRYFFPTGVSVDAIYHDRAEVERDALFDWHTPWRLERDLAGVNMRASRVVFVDSDHRRCDPSEAPAAHMIQLADLVLGSMRQCLDGASSQERKRALGHRVTPLLQRLGDPVRRHNGNSRFDHVRRVGVSFFPRNAVSLDELSSSPARPDTDFYSQRDLLGAPPDPQLTLDAGLPAPLFSQ